MAVNKVTYNGTTLIDLSSDTVAANKMLSGTTAHNNAGTAISGSISSKAAATYNVSSSNQTINASQYLSGAQTIRGVTISGISAANIAYGVTVKVGDAGDDDRIIGVTGTYTTIASGGATSAKILSGYSAYVNGQLIQGSIATYDGTVQTSGGNNVTMIQFSVVHPYSLSNNSKIAGDPIQDVTSTYQAEAGMTWGDWIDSQYNTDNFTVSSTKIRPYGRDTNLYRLYFSNLSGGTEIYPSDIIIADHTYHVIYYGSGGSN